MSKYKPNAEQLEFINTLDKNILVSASAGSGKTSTMVAKIIQLIKNKVSLDNLLIVTYTVASANEMRQKIYRALIDEMRETQNEDELKFLSEQLEKLNNCDIGTIHAICKKIISKYFYVIDQDVNFAILEKSDYLYSLALRKVFKDYIVKENHEFYQLYESYNKKRNDKILVEIIKVLHDFLNSKIDPDEWKENVLNKSYDSDVKTNVCVQFVLSRIKAVASKLFEEFKGLTNIKVDEKYDKVLDNRLAFLNQVLSVRDIEQLVTIINDTQFVVKASTSKLGAEFTEWADNYERVNENFKIFKDEVFALKELAFDKEKIEYVKNILRVLFDVVADIEKEYSILKNEKNLIDFSDLEHKTYSILMQSQEVCNELQKQYEYIFVDEYQDINELQEGIINMIKRDNNINLIGDVKQSIFAFRLATPKLFIEKYNSYPNGKNDKLIKFNQNFRSQNNILQFVNWVCDEVITKDTIGIDYKKDARLIFPSFKEEDKDQVVEISIIDKQNNDNEELENDEKEALLIVKKIKELLNKTYKSEEGDKQFNYKDIAIIARNKTSLIGKVIATLKQYDIPCNVSYKSDIFNSHSVHVVYSLLKLLYNTNDDYSFAVLLKEIGKLNELDLIKIKKGNKDSFVNICETLVQNKRLDNIAERVNRVLLLIQEYKFKLNYMSLYEVMKEFVDNIYIKLYSKKDGDSKLQDIDQFLSLLDNNMYAYDIKSCIEYLAELEGKKVDINNSANGEGVTITTIHSSKGLEYRAVIFCGLGGLLGINKNTNDIVVSNNYGVGLMYLDGENRTKQDTIIRKACLMDNEYQEVDEELRLLYVALTRGMNYLILTGVYEIGKIVNPSRKGVYSGRRFFDWIFRGLSFLDRQKFSSLKSFYINEGKDSCAKVEVDSIFDEALTEEKEVSFSNTNDNLKKLIQDNIKFKYAYISGKELSLKNSVSSILKEGMDYENVVDSFKELSLSEKVSPSESIEIGNAYHKVMQEIDFNKENDIEKIIDLCNAKKYVDKNKIRKCIDAMKCFTFNAEIYKEKQFIMKVRHDEVVENGQAQKILVQGVIDLFILEKDGITLIDYKTNKINTTKYLAELYSTQMALYALALEKAYKRPIKNVFLYSFDKDVLIDMNSYIKRKK